MPWEIPGSGGNQKSQKESTSASFCQAWWDVPATDTEHEMAGLCDDQFICLYTTENNVASSISTATYLSYKTQTAYLLLH